MDRYFMTIPGKFTVIEEDPAAATAATGTPMHGGILLTTTNPPGATPSHAQEATAGDAEQLATDAAAASGV